MQRRKPLIDKLEQFTGFRPSIPLDDIIRSVAEMGNLNPPLQEAPLAELMLTNIFSNPPTRKEVACLWAYC